MPAALSYPGVYIEELPSGVRTITGVATSIAAFVGRAKRGPTNEPVVINSYADFERKFGGLWLESALSFAVRDFYLNGGGQAIIVRLFSPTFKSETERTTELTAAKAKAQTAADLVAKAATDAAAAVPPAPAPTAQSVAKAVEDKVAEASNNNGPAAAAAAKAVAKAAADAAQANGATPQTVAAATTSAIAAAVTSAANSAAPVTRAELSANGLELEAASEGAWGNYLRARIDLDVSEEIAQTFGLDEGDLFNLTIRDTKNDITEVFRNVSVKPSPRQVDKILKASTLVHAKTPLPGATPAAHGAPAPGQDIWAVDVDGLSSKVTVPASDGNSLTQANFIGQGMDDRKEGLYALKKTDLFNLLCIPPHSLSGDIEGELITQAVALCAKHRAIMLIDPRSDWLSKEAAKSGIDTAVGEVSMNAAIFFPSLKQPNPLRSNQIEEFAPCGAVAGIFARTDASRGVWKAPAGLDATLVGVPELSVLLNDMENGELNQLGINCLRTMPAAGRVVWGSRTRVGADRLASEWKYIPVRRTALFLEESLYRGTQWVVFEPNDEPLWSQIRLNIGAFMHSLFRQGAFQGKTPQEAYLVKCDKETTTQDDINKGIVNIVVGFAPLKPAEFVVIKFQQLAGQIQM